MQQNETLKLRMPEAQEAVRTPGKVQSPEAEAWIDRIKKDLETVKEKEKIPSGIIAPKKEGIVSEPNKEAGLMKKLGMFIGDTFRDIDTASKMAADTFEGDSALMHAARGAVSFGIGAGLEKATDVLWNDIWQGKAPIFDRFRLGGDVGQRMNDYALQTKPLDINKRATYFIKESTQDLSLALLYNFFAFRGQPLLPKTEAKHLLSSLALNMGEAMFAPTLPKQVAYDASRGNLSIYNAKVAELKEKRIKLTQAGRTKREGGVEGQSMFQSEIDELMQKGRDLGDAPAVYVFDEGDASAPERVLRGLLNVSNPVTLLGAEWIWSGMTQFKKNWKEVQKIRKEHGGLAGKKVDVPKKEWHDRTPNSGYRKPFEPRGSWHDKKDVGNNVYFGRGKANDRKAQEEYDLKMDS